MVYGMPRALADKAGLSDLSLLLSGVAKGDSGGALMAKILVVDDSALSRRISAYPAMRGHVVLDAEDVIAAIESYFIVKPYLVLLDITMKGMNGIEVLQKLREMDPHVQGRDRDADIRSSTRIANPIRRGVRLHGEARQRRSGACCR